MSAFVVRHGNPTPEELAIALTVLQAAASASTVEASATSGKRSRWAAPVRLHRPGTHRFGNGAWVLAQRIR